MRGFSRALPGLKGVISVNFKKIIGILIVSICIANSAQGMETLQELASNRVVRAGMIMGLGAAVSAGSYHISRNIMKDNGDTLPNAQTGALHGVLCLLPVSLYVLCKSSCPEFSLKKWSLLTGALALSHTVPVLCNLRDKGEHDDNEFIKRHLPNYIWGKNNAITDENHTLQKKKKENIWWGHGTSYLAMGILKIYDLLPF